MFAILKNNNKFELKNDEYFNDNRLVTYKSHS